MHNASLIKTFGGFIDEAKGIGESTRAVFRVPLQVIKRDVSINEMTVENSMSPYLTFYFSVDLLGKIKTGIERDFSKLCEEISMVYPIEWNVHFANVRNLEVLHLGNGEMTLCLDLSYWDYATDSLVTSRARMHYTRQ